MSLSLSPASTSSFSLLKKTFELLPGALLCVGIAVGSLVLETVELRLFGRTWLEGLVLAILLGALIRTLWTPGPSFQAGVRFSGKVLLELAVVLLGATIDAKTIIGAGGPLLAGIVAAVVLATSKH